MDGKVAGEAAASAAAVRADNLAESRFGTGIHAAEACLAAPLCLDGEVVGTLSLYDKRSQDPAGSKLFAEEDQDVLTHFSAQAAKALARFRPFPSSVAAAETALAGP
jgi:GAF domain-containing protein